MQFAEDVERVIRTKPDGVKGAVLIRMHLVYWELGVYWRGESLRLLPDTEER